MKWVKRLKQKCRMSWLARIILVARSILSENRCQKTSENVTNSKANISVWVWKYLKLQKTDNVWLIQKSKNFWSRRVTESIVLPLNMKTKSLFWFWSNYWIEVRLHFTQVIKLTLLKSNTLTHKKSQSKMQMINTCITCDCQLVRKKRDSGKMYQKT